MLTMYVHQALVERVSEVMTIELDPSQLLAVRLMVTARFACITGGAGVGKTTSLRFALDEIDAMGLPFKLAAPTGKAAKRMTEATSHPAQTIHRLLEWRRGPQRNRHFPIDAAVVIIDEASMLDIELMELLLDAIDPLQTRLILMGDANQLAPVGPGCPFGELCESGLVPVARLTTLHRAAELSWINQAAQCVLQRKMPDLLTQRDDFKFVNVDSAADIIPAVTDLIGRATDDDMQVLIPMKPGAAGIIQANQALQLRLNPPREGEQHYARRDGTQLRIHDRVIQTRNDYQLSVFNGEVGTVVNVNAEGVTVHFADRGELNYTAEQAVGLQLAYALTIHRVQGSQFPWIIFICHSTHAHMLSPQLLYTAITRAMKGVIIVGNERGMQFGLRQQNPPRRNSGLIERLTHHKDFAA